MVQKNIHYLKNFNSHAHVERDFYFGTQFSKNGNFNSHAHVERDKDFLRYAIGKIISTHTLTWSVTCVKNSNRHAPKYFNSHAHVERDDVDNYVRKLIDNFNSHAHVERDDV